MNFLVPQLQGIDVADMWSQQDGATCHTAQETIDLLRHTFDERLISRNGPINRPPRSCNLTPRLFSLRICKVSCLRKQTRDH